MSTTRIPDAAALLAPHWPLHGPYNADRSQAAAALLGETVRYLNYATGQGAATALPYASTAGDVVGGLQSAVGLMDQTLRQLFERCHGFAADPTLYDYAGERGHAAARRRVRQTQDELVVAIGLVDHLQAVLSEAHGHLNHLGHGSV